MGGGGCSTPASPWSTPKIRQTIGAATSINLMVWHKEAASRLVTADGRWYERLGGGDWHGESWRHDRAGQPMENGVLRVTRTVEA